MSDDIIKFVIKDPLELNLSYIPFITGGGLFVPSQKNHNLGEKVMIDLQLPGKKESIKIEGKVIWITPKNALYHVLPGIGVQFIGSDAATVRGQIELHLDKGIEIGGYTYGITGDLPKEKK